MRARPDTLSSQHPILAQTPIDELPIIIGLGYLVEKGLAELVVLVVVLLIFEEVVVVDVRVEEEVAVTDILLNTLRRFGPPQSSQRLPVQSMSQSVALAATDPAENEEAQ